MRKIENNNSDRKISRNNKRLCEYRGKDIATIAISRRVL
jgi:hypothetical protein